MKEFEQSKTDCKLVMVGDAPYAASYIEKVKSTQDARILFPGAVYGMGLSELQSHCLGYVHATEVGGTHPALVEALARGARCCTSIRPENREVAGAAGLPFTAGPDHCARGSRNWRRPTRRASKACVTRAFVKRRPAMTGDRCRRIRADAGRSC